ncbi:MAG: TIGR00730 family Rossman fold protein [Acidimicrobiaceae bacterium]|nr:TIGR00730 family Rossman fold protein [Acidimicrobiaceae bacterium]
MLVTEILGQLKVTNNRDVVRHLLTTALAIAGSNFERLDLKIASDSLRELSNAFKVFEPYHLQRKVTLFGSARTNPSDPTYEVATEVAKRLAEHGWMTVTGAGQGIMQAGLEGAGPEMSFGVNIKLPHEQLANSIIANDPKLVKMKYFFTRKVMLIKESDGFVIMPGGFGTLDETFELLTLIQTGKAQPAPVVLLDAKGGTYWLEWERFIKQEVVSRGLVSPPDQSIYLITQSVDDAINELVNFYRNFHSTRFVGNRMIVRINNPVTDEELKFLNDDFGDICQSGRIERCDPTPEEVTDNDFVSLFRLSLQFNQIYHGRLRNFIDALNRLAST